MYLMVLNVSLWPRAFEGLLKIDVFALDSFDVQRYVRGEETHPKVNKVFTWSEGKLDISQYDVSHLPNGSANQRLFFLKLDLSTLLNVKSFRVPCASRSRLRRLLALYPFFKPCGNSSVVCSLDEKKRPGNRQEGERALDQLFLVHDLQHCFP